VRCRIEAFQSNLDAPPLVAEETEVMQELRALFEAEEEEQELQEVEDLLEFYLQRATSIQTEAERLLAGARDLEESIGLALSARRFEVQRLELRLSIGSFAAALGAMLAGIFGMNLRSTLEESILGFWGTTITICVGCIWVYFTILDFTRRRKILV
jgi:magnesium transporter